MELWAFHWCIPRIPIGFWVPNLQILYAAGQDASHPARRELQRLHGNPKGDGKKELWSSKWFHFQQLDMTWVDFFKVETGRWHSRAQSLDDIRDFEKLYSSNVMIVMVVQFLATFYLRCFDCFKLVYSSSLWVRFGECLDCKAFGQRCRPGQSGVTVCREATILWRLTRISGSVDAYYPWCGLQKVLVCVEMAIVHHFSVGMIGRMLGP